MTTMLDGEVARGVLARLREKRLDDAGDDYRWRRAADLSRYDAARPLTMTYPEYLVFYREELRYPNRYRRSLAIEDETGRHIGNVMYYNIDALRQEVELGITIGEADCWGRGYGTEAVRLLVEHVIGTLGYRRVHLKTLAWNERAKRCFEKAGFVPCGHARRAGNDFVLMEFRREWRATPRAASVAASH